MNILKDFPDNEGFYMPAEYEEHDGTFVIWPVRAGSWGIDRSEAIKAFANVISYIAKCEKAYVVVDEDHVHEVEKYVPMAHIIIAKTDDSWARDVSPVFVTDGRVVRGIDFGFNAWGGEYDGLYANWDNDNALALKICDELSVDCYDFKHFILEGGSIHSDGQGTVMVTESCLLSKGRNPKLTKAEIETCLKRFLGAKKVLWLPRGIYNDETNEHVDNMCAYVGPHKVVLAWTDDESDPQYKLSKMTYDYLNSECDALGRKIEIVKLPIPSHPILVDENLLNTYDFEEGEDVREVGERLAASYVNFYYTNDYILMPVFGGENAASDARAKEILESVAGRREVITIPAMAILRGGGNIHCITMQLPAV